jgi:hypothetical protein
MAVALKTCKVSCFDLKEVKHTVEVSAGSVYEAVAQALRIFRDNEWVQDIGHGQTPITVKPESGVIRLMRFPPESCRRWSISMKGSLSQSYLRGSFGCKRANAI